MGCCESRVERQAPLRRRSSAPRFRRARSRAGFEPRQMTSFNDIFREDDETSEDEDVDDAKDDNNVGFDQNPLGNAPDRPKGKRKKVKKKKRIQKRASEGDVESGAENKPKKRTKKRTKRVVISEASDSHQSTSCLKRRMTHTELREALGGELHKVMPHARYFVKDKATNSHLWQDTPPNNSDEQPWYLEWPTAVRVDQLAIVVANTSGRRWITQDRLASAIVGEKQSDTGDELWGIVLDTQCPGLVFWIGKALSTHDLLNASKLNTSKSFGASLSDSTAHGLTKDDLPGDISRIDSVSHSFSSSTDRVPDFLLGKYHLALENVDALRSTESSVATSNSSMRSSNAGDFLAAGF